MINKDTEIYCSFSSNPGNNGCVFFNDAFSKKNIDAIYKSFYSSDIYESVKAVKSLNIKGFAVSMPFKVDVLNYVDEQDNAVTTIGSANTIVNDNGYLKAYNTDYLGVMKYLETLNIEYLYILGNGGFSKAIQYACRLLKINHTIVTRDTWGLIDTLKNETLFNATPVDVISMNNNVIDGRPFTDVGKKIALEQAKIQFKLYTGEDYEIS
tara:strand:+ start:84 stop:713 length:630 start_codon:yes stop_codon:yes gene_type:complete